MNAHISAGGQQFGQKEKLTNRIKRILTGYPFDREILKELVQNADDAGATRLHFILDERCLPARGIFGDKWKQLQGPALCVFNDRPFTQEDIDGIQNLGEGSKARQLTKTGRFGVGFNCVYHITDAPSFLTSVDGGRVLCAFDPTCRYIGQATEDRPGYMYSNANDFKRRDPNVFDEYLERHYGLSGGTVFRFPLRRAQSTVSELVPSVHDIADLFTKFIDCMHETLLFLKDTTEISLKRIVCNTGEMVDIFTVNAVMSAAAASRHNQFVEQLKNVADDLANGTIQVEDVHIRDVSYKVKTVCNRDGTVGETLTWNMVHRLGFENSSQLPDIIRRESSRELLVPRGDVAYLLNRSNGPIPTHSAASVQPPAYTCRLFCFLPLPVFHGLPVHVNGHFALDYENRRNLWKYDDGGFKRDWNVCLMERVVAAAYVKLLTVVKDDILSPVTEQQLETYRSLFPSVCGCNGDQYLTALAVSVYSLIWTSNLQLFPVYARRRSITLQNLKWASPRCANFDDLVSFSSSMSRYGYDDSKSLSEDWKSTVRRILVSSGYQLIVKTFQAAEFKAAKINVGCSTIESVIQFISSVSQTNIAQSFPAMLSNTTFEGLNSFKLFLQFCFQFPRRIQFRLLGCPLLLTADERLHMFNAAAPKYICTHPAVVPHIAGDFIHKDAIDILQLNSETDDRLCRYFGIREFQSELPSILQSDTFCGLRKMVPLEEMDTALQNLSFPTSSRSDEERISIRWLRSVWSFIAAEARTYVKSQKIKNVDATTIKQSICSMLRGLNEWCLLPVTSSTNEYIIAISDGCGYLAGLDLAECQNALSPRVFNALKILKLPHINKHIILGPRCCDRDLFWLVDTLFGSPQHMSASIVTALGYLDHSNIILKTREATALAQYLSSTLSDWQGISNADNILRSLPLFQNIDGNTVRLSDYVVVNIMLDSSIQTAEWIDAVNSSQRTAFLTFRYDLVPLMEKLGCRKLTIVSVFTDYIFPHFTELSDGARRMYMTYVRDNLLHRVQCNPPNSQCDKCRLAASLKTVKFLRRALDGMLFCASAFYDPNNAVFKLFLRNNDFPPAPYTDRVWHTFLLECGLVKEVTDNQLLEFANMISVFHGQMSRARLEEKARKIVEAYSRLGQNSHNNLFRSIRFIPAYEVLEQKRLIHPQHGFTNSNTVTLLSFEGSFISSCVNESLLWTCRPLLPEWATIYFDANNQSELGIRKPAVSDVLQNMKNVSLNLERNTQLQQGTIKYDVLQIFCECYKFLQDNIADAQSAFGRLGGDLNSQKLLLIDNGRYFARPQEVVFNCDGDIRPYLFKLPSELRRFEELFKRFGTAEHTTPNHYCQVLSRIEEEGYFSPNQLTAIQKAVEGILTCLKDGRSFEDVVGMLLPTEDGELCESFGAVICDNKSFSARLHGVVSLPFMADLAYSSDLVASLLLRRLPPTIRPKFLSEIFSETLKEIVPLPLMTSSTSSSEVRRNQERLAAEEFKLGLKRLIFNGGRFGGDYTQISEYINSLSELQLVECSRIVTHLQYSVEAESLPHGMPETFDQEATERDLQYFVDGSSMYITRQVQVRSDDDNMQYALNSTIADVINCITENSLSTTLHHVVAILTCPFEYISTYLDDCHISSYDGHFVSSDIEHQQQFVPPLGSTVDADARLVHDVSRLLVGTLAALELEVDEVARRYILVEIVSDSPGDQGLPDDADATDAYFQIRSGADGDDRTTVPASRLFAFDDRQQIETISVV